ncbi:hypothetical protein BGL34_03365 [Fructilactobacillus lindneri]|uniref:Uncharacterized protein n=2 Tax=Fructilactobacillus lindneri TaxID=53444 RepID=A0A0R2JNI2_9LACO|nr:hypothetical protein [Fructilactobacillus lindneri]ANZ57833.1 hypothetical protein AYR60_03165 [Fructilactobacillus lindneri]ANZ59102.1 hypothetical protein AYR59_03165 [Fructilactobacillus lindneri]KRN78713.1 hypothetical protein IV52_GL000990 [Fructilactobacillus lindneri DSM 20690 = JCM 11027]POG98155.1 hypothetical protein BGL31_03495 [Fructilactobacillus lindneri]POH01729.1 hypothetical protein BGL32_03935 [Fructilactobacillus lindneri]
MNNYQSSELIKNLHDSLQNHTLVNVIQGNSSIFYTGMVIALDNQGVILTTYTEDGLANGLAYLTFEDISDVDFYSEDITKMEARIGAAQKLDLIGTKPAEIKLNQKVDLLTQVLGNAFVYQQPILLIKNNGTMMEGFVTSLGKRQVQLSTFDKFDSSNGGHADVLKSEVRSIEFLGLELNLLSKSKKLLLTNHIKTVEVNEQLQIYASLQRAMESGRRIIMIPKINPELFFIGQVKAVNAEAVIFSVVDMNGQFGGYELIRLDEIGELVLKSDYLRLINHFVSLNLANNTYKQPILNDERSFDDSVNMFEALLNQAMVFKRFLRIKTKDGESYFGVPFKIGSDRISLRYIDKNNPYATKRKRMNISEIDEIAFDYLEAVLARKRIMGIN